jgi:hypothetical protein
MTFPTGPDEEHDETSTVRPYAVTGGRRAIPTGPDEEHDETSTVRPYAVTGGRRAMSSSDLPLEALVEALPSAVTSRGLTPEKRRILEECSSTFVSIAELSAYLKLPLGVVRVLVTDLSDASYLKIHLSTPVSPETGQNPALSLSVLESVLNGISAL